MTRAAFVFSLTLLGLAIHASVGHAQASQIVGTALVIDGDTLEISGRRVRIAGIDAPERNQACQRVDGRVFPCGRLASGPAPR